MSYTPGTEYSAESRTVTPRAAMSSVQSWKKPHGINTAGRMASGLAGNTGFQAQLSRFDEEPRTAAPANYVARPFHEDLANGASRNAGPASFETDLALADPGPADKPSSSDFSFDDVIDIINPLQHLPVVSMIYREITGDTIKPMAQIIGGGLYGGPVGAISGTVNAVVQEETGKDIAGNVLALVIGEDGVATPSPDAAPAAIDRNNPEMALSLASAQYTGEQYVPYSSIEAEQAPPATAMSFAARKAAQAYEKAAVAEGRTAGWSAKVIEQPPLDVDYGPAEISVDNLPPREAITVLPLSSGPTFGGIY
jgi:hypothetical protein